MHYSTAFLAMISLHNPIFDQYVRSICCIAKEGHYEITVLLNIHVIKLKRS